ncbi:MAG: MgtC/SapB family protein [Gemmatimonadetes bacterium]|nr:MgtC/SapB family protein [Gemmatimonadota bacterium]
MTDLNAAMLRVLVAALLGGFIGVERERSHGEQQEHAFAGARTFPLFAILGATLTLVSGEVGAAVIAGFLGLAALVVASYVITTTRTHPGATTETAAFAAFWIGVMAGAGALLLAGAIGVGTVVLLASKNRVDTFSRALTREELSATLTLAVIAAVILPALPDTNLGPWGVWNPRKLWLVVVLVCGLSFLAFIAMRVWGATRGLYLSGILGGLVSSTAATVSFATRSREVAGHEVALAVAAGLASVVMVLRVAVLAWISNQDVTLLLAPFLATVALAGTVVIAILARRGTGGEKAPDLSNPFQLKTALKFALLYAAVLLVVEGAKREFGSWGLMAAAVLTGLTDVDAITLALAGSASLPAEQAAGGIALAALSNTLAKSGYAVWLGKGPFRRAMLFILGTAFVAGVAAVLVIGPRPWADGS